MSCIVRTSDTVVCSVPFALMEDNCYTEDSGSLEEEISRQFSHVHPLFKEDNASVCHFLEEETWSTVCSASTKPFQKKKDGQNSWFSMVKQHASEDQW